MTIAYNPPAFPSRCDMPMPGGGSYRDDPEGMTLRDWFAGQALPASLNMPHVNGWEVVHREELGFVEAATTHAYRVADAMLAARATASLTQGDGHGE